MGDSETHRLHVTITGLVQGVGFRPFVWRLANQRDLPGWVRNTTNGVEIEVEGAAPTLAAFRTELEQCPPPLARIDTVEVSAVAVTGAAGFEVLHSSESSGDSALIGPDVAVCPACLGEMADPSDRRYRYPFVNCTDCGPRFTIVKAVPYDRARTSMGAFPLCRDCRDEYDDPRSRRFHAEPIACPECGPQVSLCSEDRETLAVGEGAVAVAGKLLSTGRILAVKGLGGFHLACDAGNDETVARLRKRKNRPHRPLAVMCRDPEAVKQICVVSAAEERELTGFRKPILLLRRRESAGRHVSALVAPGHRNLGVMLPYTPLHDLLLRGDSPRCLVMTSANRAGDPIIADDESAFEKLTGVADAFLTHDREIISRCDDSVGYVENDKLSLLRRSRGFCPLPLTLPVPVRPTLALGAMFSNAFAVARGRQVFLSQHIGDVDSAENLKFLRSAIEEFVEWLGVEPEIVAHDMHPDLLTTHLARELAADRQVVSVQHHHAHLVSAAAAAGIDGMVQGLVFDGTGWAPDGTIWGGELLVGAEQGFERAGHLLPLPLPGGDAAIRRPLRIATAYLHALAPETATVPLDLWRRARPHELHTIRQMVKTGINTPLTSSVGRLFDAVSSLLGLCDGISYDGQAAMELEQLALRGQPCELMIAVEKVAGAVVLNPTPLLRALVNAVLAGEDRANVAAGFHRALAVASAEACAHVHNNGGPDTVVLCGGVFQNRLLREMTRTALESAGLRVVSPVLVPPGDGGLALGQVLVANSEARLCEPPR